MQENDIFYLISLGCIFLSLMLTQIQLNILKTKIKRLENEQKYK